MKIATTCQICGRPIKANTGVIAHHGYMRPDAGWQTASCAGARYLPYEQSRDRIPEVIENVKGYITGVIFRLETVKVTAPEKLLYEKYVGSGRHELVDVPRPDDFDIKTARDNYVGSSYTHLYFRLIHSLETDIKMSKRSLDALTQRYVNWKAPEPTPILSDTEMWCDVFEMAVR